jgi:hypothetical protein
MSAFATAAEMSQRTGGLITSTSHPFLAKELDAASRQIREYCGWHIATVESVTLKRVSRFAEDVWLPAMRISALTTITIDGAEWSDPSAADFDRDTGWTNLRGHRVEVGYVAGFETVPEDLMSLTLQMAARALGSPLGVVREQAGSVSVTYSQPGSNVAGGTTLLEHEKAALSAYMVGYLP